MAFEIIMPKNGMDMQEGTLTKWLKNVGDYVEKDEPLIEIETDKITMEEPSAHSGILLAQLIEEGDTVPVLQVIGYIGEQGEEIPKPVSAQKEADTPAQAIGDAIKNASALVQKEVQAQAMRSENGALPATPYAKTLAQTYGIALNEATPTGKHGEIIGADIEAVRVSPLAKRIADDYAVDLQKLKGSGVQGKIMSADVYGAIDEKAPDTAMYDAVSAPMSSMRKTIAKSMSEASRIPTVTENAKADVTELLSVRERLNEGRSSKFSINDFVLRAVAKALAADKALLVSMGENDSVIKHNRVHLGMAVALDEGLIVPVIHDADKLSFSALSQSASELASKARSGKLSRSEFSGSTFSISNVGMFGITSFTPIINMPNAAILGVCAIQDELALVDEKVVVRKKMGLSLTFDHRLVDGVPPAKFLMALKSLLENPLQIIL